MTYDVFEISREDGQPVDLYQFTQGSDVRRFTNAERDVSFNNFQWQSETIARSEPRRSQEENADQLKVTMPFTNTIAQRFLRFPPAVPVELQILRFHRSDGANPQAIIFWSGRIVSASFDSEGVATLQGKSGAAALSREVPRYTYSSVCPYQLYGPDCQQSEAGFRFELDVISIVGDVYTISGLTAASGGDPSFFVGGDAATLDGTDVRTIVGQAGDDATLFSAFEEVAPGQTLVVRAGCDHSLATCHQKFGNSRRCGCFAFRPLKNPYTEPIDR